MQSMVRTRIPPSPTGEDLHIGNLYTALINWTVAKKHRGQFIVRIEDTDRARLKQGSEEQILKTLVSYNLIPDESPQKGGPYGPYRQSERLDLYQHYAQKLVKEGHAYYCNCTPERLIEQRRQQQKQGKMPKYDRKCMDLKLQASNLKVQRCVIRMKIPKDKNIVFDDLIHGTITFKSEDIDDQVILKSDGYPTYHLAVVVDDHLMKVSHVIRAEEWISSTPKHVLLYEALGWDRPLFAHLPILRNPDRSKLSKRKNPVWASWYLEQGFLKEAVLNYLALMGWSHPKEKEIFSLEEFIEVFDLKDVKAVGPVFDKTKLEWMNGEYIRMIESEDLKDAIYKFFGGEYSKELIKKTIPLVQKRIKTLREYDDYCKFFIKAPKKYEKDISGNEALFKKIYKSLEEIEVGEWRADNIGQKMQDVAKDSGLSNSKFFMLLRVAVAGKKVTPPLNESMEILGKDACLDKIKKVT